MIVKIWSIDADNSRQKGKVGGWQGVRNAVNYIYDIEKVIVPEEDVLDYGLTDTVMGLDSPLISEKDFHRVIDYVANEDKTEAKYVSTYMCGGSDVVADFRLAAEQIAFASRGKTKTNSGAMAFHIVQSFPMGLDISNEEVHQCGIELVKRLEKYQAVICSHVHPVVDEKGVVHGRTKHNHIIINAFMHPVFYDPKVGGPRKFHKCDETYRQLQIFNDEIAIEHGLPIIQNPDEDKVYSWHEAEEKKKGASWKERVRIDITNCRKTAKNWDQFVKCMQIEGYDVKEKTHVTYTTPDGNKVRDNNLGTKFTKNSLEAYWAVRDQTLERIKIDLQENERIALSDYVVRYGEELTVKIPLGNDKTGEKTPYYLPLNKDIKADDAALRTYVRANQVYDICNIDGEAVAAASGLEIVQSMEDLRDEDLMKFKTDQWLFAIQRKARRGKRERKREEEEKEARKNYYENQRFKNSRTGNPYRAGVYDEDGRRRTTIELIIILALIVLDKEEYLWTPGEVRPNQENEEFFASTNWRIQNLVDAIELARIEDLESPAQLDRRLDAVGAELSRARSALEKVSAAKERMDPVAKVIDEYKQNEALAKSILNLPDGEEKTKAQVSHADTLEKYNASKQLLECYKITDASGVVDFERRYARIQKDIKGLEKHEAELREHYRRLKKLEHSLALAEDPYYLYGPGYREDDLQHKTQQKNFFR